MAKHIQAYSLRITLAFSSIVLRTEYKSCSHTKWVVFLSGLLSTSVYLPEVLIELYILRTLSVTKL